MPRQVDNFFGHITPSDKMPEQVSGSYATVSYTTKRCELINLEGIELSYLPFPFAVLSNVFETSYFDRLCDTFPDDSYLSQYNNLGNKLLLSENSNSERYANFLKQNHEWRQLYQVVKSPEFVDYILSILYKLNVDLNCKGMLILRPDDSEHPHEGLVGRLEFSSMPAHGGAHRPHTDLPKKVVSIVVSMTRNRDWNPAYGGETVIYSPKKPEDSFNLVDRYRDFDDMNIIKALPFRENCGNLIVKTHNSWHGVSPLKAEPGETARRRTIVLQIYRIHPSIGA